MPHNILCVSLILYELLLYSRLLKCCFHSVTLKESYFIMAMTESGPPAQEGNSSIV